MQDVASRMLRHGVKIHQTTIDKIEKRDTERPRHLRELAMVLGVTEEWLLSGKEPKLRPPELPPPALEIPVLAWVSAGAMTKPDLADDQIGIIRVGDIDPKGDWIALQVTGDSMDRISPPGSIILVNRREKRLVPNACYVVADHDDQVTYKRYRPNPDRLEPVSTNPSHEPIFYEQEPTVIGRVRKTILEM